MKRFFEVSAHSLGTHPMQTYIEMCSVEDEQVAVIRIMKKDVFKYAFDPKANYVLIAVLKRFKPEFLIDITAELITKAREMSIN